MQINAEDLAKGLIAFGKLINETAIKINKMGPNEKIAFALFFQVKQEILSCFDMEDQREILKKLIEDLQDFQESLQP